MARPIDLSSLTKPERAVLLSGTLLFVDGIIPWWYRVQTTHGTYSYNAGLNGWGTAAVAAGAVAVVAVLLRASIWPEPAPVRDGTAYAALGAIAIAFIIVQIARARGGWIGLYAGLFLAICLFVAGLRRRTQRRAGWT